MAHDKFINIFVTELFARCYEVQTHNMDFIRFAAFYSNPQKKLIYWIRDKLFHFVSTRNFVYVDKSSLGVVIDRLTSILNQIEKYEDFYNLLQNESSRQLMIKLLVFRVLGNLRVKLPTNTPHYWESVRMTKKLLKKSHTMPIPTLNGYLDYYELKEIDFPIRLHAHALNILGTFLLQQYRYEEKGRIIEVESGEVVIDAGSCWGDSALYFAHKTGKDGQIFCFEFLLDNLSILRKNLDLNDHLNNRIQIIPEALWNKSGEDISYHEESQSTRLTPNQIQASRTCTKAIDDFVKEQGLKRIDFIKMDIEGAELKALQGAEQTIKAFRPKLAISLYHRDDDFIVIPRYLDNLKLGYEFFLCHFTIHREETVLFARIASEVTFCSNS